MAALTQNPVAASGSSEAETSSSAAASSAQATAVFQRLHPGSYLAKFLAKGYRPDGRKIGEWRDVSINTGSISTANGSSLVRMGETTMVCGIKAEIAEPRPSSPLDGYIVPNVDLPALCSPKFKPGPPGDEAQVYSTWINELLTSSQTIPLNSLCISPGKAVYTLYIDVVCINYDGNAFDAAVLAVMAALKNTRLPKAVYDPVTGQTICSRDETFPLKLGKSIPLSCGFGIFQSTHILPDPTSFETPLLPTRIVIAMDESDQATFIRQEGLGGIAGVSGSDVLGNVWGMASARTGELRRILEES